MDFAVSWYRRFEHLIHEAAKFGVVGAVGLVMTNGGYYLLHSVGSVGPVTSTTIATILATVVTYLGNRYWSFQHRERTGVAREGLTFLVLNGIGLLIQDAVVGFNAYVLGFQQGHRVEQFVALNFGIAIATLFRFWSYRKWVWAAPALATAGPAGGLGQASSGEHADRLWSPRLWSPRRDAGRPVTSRRAAGRPAEGGGQRQAARPGAPQPAAAQPAPVRVAAQAVAQVAASPVAWAADQPAGHNGWAPAPASRTPVRVNGRARWGSSVQPGPSSRDN